MLEELDLDLFTQTQTNETSVSIQQDHSFIAVLEFRRPVAGRSRKISQADD